MSFDAYTHATINARPRFEEPRTLPAPDETEECAGCEDHFRPEDMATDDLCKGCEDEQRCDLLDAGRGEIDHYPESD